MSLTCLRARASSSTTIRISLSSRASCKFDVTFWVLSTCDSIASTSFGAALTSSMKVAISLYDAVTAPAIAITDAVIDRGSIAMERDASERHWLRVFRSLKALTMALSMKAEAE